MGMNKMSLDEKFEVGDALGTSNNISSSVSSGSVTSGTVSEPVKFVVKSTDPRHHPSASSGSSSNCTFVCYAPAQEATSEWVETIKQILQSQRDFLKAIQSPIKYQNEQQRLSTIDKDV